MGAIVVESHSGEIVAEYVTHEPASAVVENYVRRGFNLYTTTHVYTVVLTSGRARVEVTKWDGETPPDGLEERN